MIIVFILVTSPVRARRATPSLTAFPPVPIPSPNPPNRASPPSVSPKIPAPHFHQISLPSALSPTAKMILWNVMGWVRNGHAQYTATQKGMKWRAADGKLLSARVIHENESGPTPTKPTPPRFICALRVPEPKLTDTWTSMGYPSVGHSLGWKVMFTKNIFKRIDFLRFYFYLCHMSDILYLSFKQH